MPAQASQGRPPVLSVVIPVYNEEARLPASLPKVLEYLEGREEPYEVVLVDDGSTDSTAEIAERMAESSPHLKLIRNRHRGKAYAVRTGVLAAQGDVILFSDVDLATPIEEAEKLLAELKAGYDVAYGSREGMGAERLDEPLHRHLMGRVFNFLVQTLALPGVQDSQCGFKAFRRAAAQDIFRRVQLYGEGSPVVRGSILTGFDVEVLFLARRRGYGMVEVPVVWRYDRLSKVNPLRDSWRNLHDVLRVRWNALRGRYPQTR